MLHEAIASCEDLCTRIPPAASERNKKKYRSREFASIMTTRGRGGVVDKVYFIGLVLWSWVVSYMYLSHTQLYIQS